MGSDEERLSFSLNFPKIEIENHPPGSFPSKPSS
jgi:hypothetical protein